MMQAATLFCKLDECYIITYTIRYYVMFLRYMNPHTQTITNLEYGLLVHSTYIYTYINNYRYQQYLDFAWTHYAFINTYQSIFLEYLSDNYMILIYGNYCKQH